MEGFKGLFFSLFTKCYKMLVRAVLKENFELNGCFLIYALKNSRLIHF